jgi:dTDP-4-amino-4,6-dideoxygalactose transaminase
MPEVHQADRKAVIQVITSDWYTMGPCVHRFEKHLCQYLGLRFGAAVNSGTSALDVAMKILGIRAGDEVIVPVLSYIATANAVTYNNGTPVFVDIDETLNLNPAQVETKVREKTKAIVITDFGGNPAAYDQILKIARSNGVPVVVDGAQSLGAEYHGVKCCTHGRINTTSFHMAKLISTIEGGMVFTKTKTDYEQACLIRNQGEAKKYVHVVLGNNYRMTDISAALGDSQLRRLDSIVEKRRKYALYYREELKDVEYPAEHPGVKNSFFLFPILVNNRDRLQKYLAHQGIESRVTYPMPINRQPIYRGYSNETFERAEETSRKILTLPIYGALTQDQRRLVVKSINAFSVR